MKVYLSKFAERISEEEFNKKENSNFYYFSLSKEITKTEYIGEVAKPTKVQMEFYYKIENEKAIKLSIKKLIALYKAKINEEVNNLIVELDGYEFQANEKSQDRILKKIQTLNDNEVTEWIILNNDKVKVSKQILQNVLNLAVSKQSEIVIKYRELMNDLENKTLDELLNLSEEM